MENDLARRNGRVCFHSGRPMKDSNPYRSGTRNHSLFEESYREAALASMGEKTRHDHD